MNVFEIKNQNIPFFTETYLLHYFSFDKNKIFSIVYHLYCIVLPKIKTTDKV